MWTFRSLLVSLIVCTQLSARAQTLAPPTKPFPKPDIVLRDASHKEPKSGVQFNSRQLTIQSGVGTPTTINALSFSADGALLAAGKDFGRVVLWDVLQRKFLRAIETDQGIVTSVALSPNGNLLVTGGHGDKFSVKFWDVTTGRLIKTLRENEGFIQCIVFDPSGKWLAVADNSGKAYIFDVTAGTKTLSLTDTHIARFSQDGTILVTSDQEEFAVWTTANWAKTKSIPKTKPFAYLLAVHPVADRFAVYQAWDVKLLGLDSGEIIEGSANILPRTNTGPPSFAEFNADGSLLFASVTGNLWVWHTRTNQTCASPTMYSGSGALSADGRWFAGAKDDSILFKERTDGVWVWDTSHLLSKCDVKSSQDK